MSWILEANNMPEFPKTDTFEDRSKSQERPQRLRDLKEMSLSEFWEYVQTRFAEISREREVNLPRVED